MKSTIRIFSLIIAISGTLAFSATTQAGGLRGWHGQDHGHNHYQNRHQGHHSYGNHYNQPSQPYISVRFGNVAMEYGSSYRNKHRHHKGCKHKYRKGYKDHYHGKGHHHGHKKGHRHFKGHGHKKHHRYGQNHHYSPYQAYARYSLKGS